MTALDAILGVAVACGVAGALTGNRTAWALLASVAFCLAMDGLEVAFNFFLWLMVDLAAILVIVRRAMTPGDVVILALFLPAWAGYLMPPDIRFQLGFAAVVAQLLLTFPAKPVFRAVQRVRKALGSWGRPDRMVTA